MTPGRAFGYLALCLVLLGYYYLFESAPRQAEPMPPRVASFLDLRAADVHSIELQAAGKRLRCVRGERGWQVVEPADTTVPGDLITALVTTLTDPEPAELVSPGGSQAGDFGLDAPRGRVVLEPLDGAPVTVALGQRNPAQTAIYARREGVPEIFLIGLNVQYYVDLALEHVRPSR